MASNIQSNPVYYSLSALSSGENLPTRTVVLRKRSDHAGFGVYIGEDVPAGLYIVTVERNSPASDANLQPGDRVLAVNGQMVTTMKDNPKETLIREATNAQTLTLTVQSTDIIQSLNIPLANSSTMNIDRSSFNQYPTRQTFNITSNSMDLESYVKSLFANEDVHIIPSSRRNEFILDTNSHARYPGTFDSLPNRTYDLREPEPKKKHRRHHHHHNRNHRSKGTLLQTKETQTSIDQDSHENIPPMFQQQQQSPSRQHLSQPSMGTSQLVSRGQQQTSFDNTQHEPPKNQSSSAKQELRFQPAPSFSSSDSESPVSTPAKLSTNSKNTAAPMSHLVDVVSAAMHAKQQADQSDHHAEVPSRDSAPTIPRSQPEDHSQQIPAPTTRPNTSSQLQRMPASENPSRETVATTNRTAAVQPQQQQQQAPPPQEHPRDSATTSNRTAAVPQQQRIPPQENSARTSATVNNRENPSASSNQQAPPPYTPMANDQSANHSDANNARAATANESTTTSVRPTGTREIHLTRIENFQGFGFHLQYNKVYYLVQRIEANSPAEVGGLYANDVILSINQQKTDGMAHGTFVQIVNSNSSVTLLVQPVEEYLRAHPPRARNQPVASAIAATANMNSLEEPEKQRNPASKILNKITNR